MDGLRESRECDESRNFKAGIHMQNITSTLIRYEIIHITQPSDTKVSDNKFP
jgi:hypothetical protein